MNMIAIVLVTLTAQQQPAADASQAAEIQVIGRKLKDWRATLTSRKGVYRCKIHKSTGDADIDAIGCSAMTNCFPEFEPRLIAAKKLDARERKEARATVNRELSSCVTSRGDKMVEDLAERRYRERADAS